MSEHAVAVRLGAHAKDCSVSIDGHDITRYLSGVKVIAEGGTFVKLELTIAHPSVVIELKGAVSSDLIRIAPPEAEQAN